MKVASGHKKGLNSRSRDPHSEGSELGELGSHANDQHGKQRRSIFEEETVVSSVWNITFEVPMGPPRGHTQWVLK